MVRRQEGSWCPVLQRMHKLIEKVSRVICIHIYEFDIEMKFNLKTFYPMPPIPIMSDDDVDYFLEETISGAELKIPLCITYQRKQILVTPITHVDPTFGPDSCPKEPVERYVEGEGLSPNNFVAEDQSIFEFVPETQPNDRRLLSVRKCIFIKEKTVILHFKSY